MPMYHLIEYVDDYSKISRGLSKYYRDDLDKNSMTKFEFLKLKAKVTSNIPTNDNTKHFEIAVPLKYLGNFWRTLERLLINCDVNLNSPATGAKNFALAITNLYTPAVTLSTRDNSKLLQLSKQNLQTIKWN